MNTLQALFGGHGLIVPVVLPLVAGSLLLVLETTRSRWVPALSLLATLALVWVAVLLVLQADSGEVQAYLLSNWQAPFGIALAMDRLSAMMLLLTAGVGTAALLYALAGEDRQGPHFHALFQFQLMGLNGAFLTADLFNLFVFFEVLLAASYGLLLHGGAEGRRGRLMSGVHYIVFNLAGSALFLVAATLFYGLTGTLNMADLAQKVPLLPPENQRLALAAGGLLLVVFAVKAALLPLYFWLPDTYASATPPVAALFAVLTKVGVYCIARVTTLGFTGLPELLAPLALATLVLAAIGALAATRLRGLVAYLVVSSAGTLLLAVGLGTEDALAAGLFYLLNSTLIAAAWFLLADRLAARRGGSDALQPRPFAGPRGLLGSAFFFAAVAVAGVPPLAGFLGKALLLQAAGTTPLAAWVLALVLGSSLALMVALARAGSTLLWKADERSGAVASSAAGQHAGLALLLAGVLGCAVLAEPISHYTASAAWQLHDRQAYLAAVLGARPAPPAYDVRREMRERGGAK